MFSPNAGKYGPEKNSVFGYFSSNCFYCYQNLSEPSYLLNMNKLPLHFPSIGAKGNLSKIVRSRLKRLSGSGLKTTKI